MKRDYRLALKSEKHKNKRVPSSVIKNLIVFVLKTNTFRFSYYQKVSWITLEHYTRFFL